MGIIKTIGYIIAAIILIPLALACVAAFAFGVDEGFENTDVPTTDDISTETRNFYPHSCYAEAYIPSITEIGDGRDWYMTDKETEVEGLVCQASYTKDEHRIVTISVSVCPTIDGAKVIYDEFLESAPYVECPTMGVCDQSHQYVKEIPGEYGMDKEVGTGIIRDGNIIVIFKVYEDNMFFGLNSYDMERYAKNIEKKINSV